MRRFKAFLVTACLFTLASTHVVHARAKAPGLNHPAHLAITRDLFNGYVRSARPFGSGNAHANQVWQVQLQGNNCTRNCLVKQRPWGDRTPDGTGQARTPMDYVGYRLNLMLGMDYIPPTAYRRNMDIKGSAYVYEGAVSYQVPNVTTLKKVPQNKRGFDKKLFLSDVRVLDIILQNNDRHSLQVLWGKHWTDGRYRPVLVDHDSSLRPGAAVTLDSDNLWPGLPAFNGGKVRVIRKSTFDHLKRLNFNNLKQELGAFVSNGEIRGMLHRRDGVVGFFNNNPNMIKDNDS